MLDEVQGNVPTIETNVDAEIAAAEVEVVKEEAPVVETQIEEKPQYNEHEVRAMEKGWKPKEQFVGDTNDWKPAKQWLEFGDLLDTVHNLKRKSEESQRQVETVLEISKKAQEKQREQYLNELKQKHREAIDEADYDKADQVVDEITKIRTENTTAAEPPKPENNQPELHPEVVKAGTAFIERNKHWYNTDPANKEMVNFAKIYEDSLARTSPDLHPQQRFEELEKVLKIRYANKFENSNQNKPSITETGNTDANPKDQPKDIKLSDLPPDLQRLAKGLSPDAQKQYVKDCKTAGLI